LATTNPQETSIRHLSRHLCRISRASPAKHSRFRCHTCRRQAVASAGRAVRSRAALPALPQRRWRQCSLHGRHCAMREPAEGRARLPCREWQSPSLHPYEAPIQRALLMENEERPAHLRHCGCRSRRGEAIERAMPLLALAVREAGARRRRSVAVGPSSQRTAPVSGAKFRPPRTTA
jgi:hypothetical protein